MDQARQRIVVGVDGSDGARAALVWALTEAAARSAPVEVMTAFPVDFYWTDAYLLDTRRVEAIRADTEARARAMVDEVRLDRVVAGLPGVTDLDVSVLVVAGPAAAHLVQRSDGAGLLVVGSRGRGAMRSAVAGSVALHCAAHAKCPVLVVHPLAVSPGEPRRVVVGLDDSEHAGLVLTAAVVQAQRLGARVDAVLVREAPNYWSDSYAVIAPPLGESAEHVRKRGEAAVAAVLGPGPVDPDGVRVVAVEGRPGQALVREAEGALMLVVGSRSHNQLQGLVLGSAALHCVMYAPCPVLVVRERPEDAVGRQASSAPGAVFDAD